ncbi:MAG: hypothetical protein ACKPKO_11960, partial [Candidatus Fonsibacter sp.]
STIDFDNIKYFVRSTEKQAKSWEELPEDIKNTYDRLGIPDAERQRLVAGVAAQYESEVEVACAEKRKRGRSITYIPVHIYLTSPYYCAIYIWISLHIYPICRNHGAILVSCVTSAHVY